VTHTKLGWSRVSLTALGLALFSRGVPAPLTGTLVEAAEPPFSCSPAARPANLTLALKDLNNVELRLSDFKGKVILLNFWATWCGPCKIETPWFIDLQDRYGKDGLQVLGISIDDPMSLLKPYAAGLKINYPVLQGLGHKDEMSAAFGVLRGVPTTFIISREGKLCAKHIGATAREGYESQVKGLLQVF
jgi:cytochrome c biogenesis protein CcmG/thiol:disulfide interchange protein DsbE